MDFIRINDNLSLTFSVKENIRILKRLKSPFKIVKDHFLRRKVVSLITNFYDSNVEIEVRFSYSIFSRLFGLNSIIVTIADKSSDNIDTSADFATIEKILENRNGLPKYCDGSSSVTYFYIDNLLLVNSVKEFGDGCDFHSLRFYRKTRLIWNPINYDEYLRTKEIFANSIAHLNLKILLFYYSKKDFGFMCENERFSFYGRLVKNQLQIYPLTVEKNVDKNGVLTKHVPHVDKRFFRSVSSTEEILVVINEYFKNFDASSFNQIHNTSKQYGPPVKPMNNDIRGLISKKERKFYTYMKEIIVSLDIPKDFIWLISDIEACPRSKLASDLVSKEYLILTNGELLDLLNDDDFQWIWAVFLLFKSETKNEEILNHGIPLMWNAEVKSHEEHPTIQHPKAILEIDACDSSWVILSSKEEVFFERFKRLFPNSKELS